MSKHGLPTVKKQKQPALTAIQYALHSDILLCIATYYCNITQENTKSSLKHQKPYQDDEEDSAGVFSQYH